MFNWFTSRSIPGKGFFFKKFVAYYARYEQLPVVSYIYNEINKYKEKQRKDYFEVLERIVKEKPRNDRYIKEQLEEFVKRNKILR